MFSLLLSPRCVVRFFLAGLLLFSEDVLASKSAAFHKEERFLETQELPTTCASMQRICTEDGAVTFTAQAGVLELSTSDQANDFECLAEQPNPTWYYFNIAEAGDLFLSLSAPKDIDYIIWGPFADADTAVAACNGGLTSSLVVSCSYSTTNVESPSVSGALVDEVYVLLVTNYEDAVQTVTFDKSGGEAETGCAESKSTKSTKTPTTKAPSTKAPVKIKTPKATKKATV